jgi:hypothetical protein
VSMKRVEREIEERKKGMGKSEMDTRPTTT